MMKSIVRHIILVSILIWSVTSIGQTDEKLLLNAGVDAYNNGDYASAQNNFEEAYSKNNNYNLALYNAANAAYRNGDFDKALEYYNQYAGTLHDKNNKAKAYHNVGNAYLKQEKLGESIEAYKNALRNNPNDEDTRYNLSYALSKLQQQQQNQDQNQNQNKDNKDQDQNKDQQNKDQQNKDQQNKDGEGDQNEDQQGEQNKDQQDGDKEEQDQKDGEGDQEKDKQEEKEGNQPKPGDRQNGEEKEVEGQMTKAQIEKDLDAINNEEKNILLKIAREKGKEKKTSSTKDW